MKPDSITGKLIVIAIIGGACFAARLMVYRLVAEREERFATVKQEIANSWGVRQVLVGPMLIFSPETTHKDLPPPLKLYLLPETLHLQTELIPEKRSRGIFDTIVYTSRTKVSGTFLASEIARVGGSERNAIFSVGITDTRGIEKQLDLSWGKEVYPFRPSAKSAMASASGIHTGVPVRTGASVIPFSFDIELKGSEGISFAPVGKETYIAVASKWGKLKFTGEFLPASREITDSDFSAEWNISSFGQTYPGSWSDGEVDQSQLLNSAAGVDLLQSIDIYDQLYRSIKYAILFIVITFAAFFVFEILAGLRIHPVQYLLIGASLALFYLLLLSLSEHIGFLPSYLLSTLMTALLITVYSTKVLQSRRRAYPIFALLVILYGYLFFVLQLEDYALLFGSLLLFVLLSMAMHLTRNVNWFEPTGRK